MTTYICKCGRRVQKSSNADNTGNRIENYRPGFECYGCPYAMPWGRDKWDEETKHFVQDVKGYECRMSKTLSYASQFIGSTKDKCTCSVVSLDFDFLEQISAWVKETFTLGELTGHFSRDEIRATDYSHDGRYNYGLCCAGNKKGIAAKAALFAQFFNQDGSRKDMTPQQEMEKVLTDIRKAKEATECATVPNADAAATTAESAVPNATEETLTTSASAADASASAPAASPQTCESAPGASAEDSSALLLSTTGSAPQDKPAAPTFDFGADDQTNALLLQDAQTFITGNMARIMAAKHAHDLTANHYQGSWGKWCAAVGISRDTGDRMVSVAAQCGNIQLEGKFILDVQPLKLLYAAAKPSTPEVVKQAVFTGDITTYKEYQELMAQFKAEKERADTAEHQLEAANADITGLTEQNSQLKENLDAAEAREEEAWQMQSKAEARAKDAESQLSGSRQVAEAAKLRAEKLKAENDALKKQPIVGVTDPEEVDRLAHQQAYGIAADMTDEIKKEKDALQKQLKDRDRQLNVMRRQVNDLAQTDFEIANNFQVQIWSAWNSCKSSYSRLVGEDLESTFLAICQAMDGVKEEAARLCRQPVGYDGGADDEPDV